MIVFTKICQMCCSRLVLHRAFVCARGALNGPKRRFVDDIADASDAYLLEAGLRKPEDGEAAAPHALAVRGERQHRVFAHTVRRAWRCQ